jgi:3-oxoacyl-[acyl-carrier-protein] synthase II
MMSRDKLKEGRTVSQALAPFDIDAAGTIVGNAGYGILVTTLEFALANFLDITSIIVGWGQSGETGGKAHFAGVGYGGENAIIMSLMMAFEEHGFGVNDFEHLLAHATGTRTNSKTDLATVLEARRAAAQMQGYSEKLRRMTVGAPKASDPGPDHPMGPAGHLATDQGNQYLLGRRSVGIPNLRNVDPDLAQEQEYFELSHQPVAGNEDGGEIKPVQGFGGYVAAMARKSANPDTIRRYRLSDPRLLDAYLERRDEVRRDRERREAAYYRTIGSTLAQAVQHRWPGAK